IAPADSAFRAAKMMGGRSQKFILGGSGHIAGVVNHPDLGKYHYWTKTGLKGATLGEWRDGTTMTKGSWWPDWDMWLAKKSSKQVPAREPGATLGAIEPAPGSYVKKRADAK
ncbi:MAG: class I poly(R)-hydroxyalkanoic acid synthase, partial [Pseudomonadota bacterium]